MPQVDSASALPPDQFQLFRLLFERSADAHLLIAGDSLLECNQAAVSLLGYPSKAALLATRPSHFSADSQLDGRPPAIHVAEITAIVARTGSHRFEWLHRRAEGSSVPVEVLLTELSFDDTQVAHVVLRDITLRKQQEMALQRLNRDLAHSRNVLHSLFDSFNDGLLLLSANGQIAMVNRAFSALLGSEPTELLGRPWNRTARRYAPAFPRRLAPATLRDSKARNERTRYRMPGGQVRVLDLQTFPLGQAQGQRADQVVLRVVDMTDRLQLDVLAMQHERFAANARLAAAVAHEIKSPLQALYTLLYLAEGEAEAERNTYITLAREEIVRLGEIVDRLTDDYRPHASHMGPLDSNALVERVLLLTGGLLSRTKIMLTRQLDPQLPLAWGRSDQLTQVLLNLIFNAADAMPEGGTLHLRTFSCHNPMQQSDLAAMHWTQADEAQPFGPGGPTSAGVLIELRDSGRGIAPAVISHLFSPFFTTKPNGMGLGLAVSRRLMIQHNGAIGVTSLPDQGSIFVLSLPLADSSLRPNAATLGQDS